MNESMKHFIKSLPKCELHLHIEGSFEPELMFEIGKRNNIKSRFKTIDEVKAAYNFHNLQSFLDIYYEGANVLIHEKDFYDLTYAYLTKVHADNVKHTEIFFDPQTHTDRGVKFETVIKGIKNALIDGEKNFGITHKLIMCFLRHLSEESALRTLEQAKPFIHLIDGVGLDSSEFGHPPIKFKKVFQCAHELGLHLVAHAGEEGPAEYIWQALKDLRVERIDHGVRASEDQALMSHLKENQIPLTVCPLSNQKLCVYPDLTKHNLKEMLHYGIKVTINSDDPAYFGGYMNDNFIATTKALDLSQNDLVQICINSFEASFLTRAEKDVWIRNLKTYLN
jgi:adenosine deaminase